MDFLKLHGIGLNLYVVKKDRLIDYYDLNKKEEVLLDKKISDLNFSSLIYCSNNIITFKDRNNVHKLDLDGNIIWSREVVRNVAQISIDNENSVWVLSTAFEDTSGSGYYQNLYKLDFISGVVLKQIKLTTTTVRCIDCGNFVYLGYHNGRLDKYNLDGTLSMTATIGTYDFMSITGAKYGGTLYAVRNDVFGVVIYINTNLQLQGSAQVGNTSYYYNNLMCDEKYIYVGQGITDVHKLDIATKSIVWRHSASFSSGTIGAICLNKDKNEICYTRTVSSETHKPGMVFLDNTTGNIIKSIDLPSNYLRQNESIFIDNNEIYISYYSTKVGSVIGVFKSRRCYKFTEDIKILRGV
ncbi:MAG: hypothetical protein RR486_09085 [Clostridium sp.]|uniref:hypothetical protein n=1 Tax=Clostridium sp. TaxID=1506 RepID=UPI00302E7F40